MKEKTPFYLIHTLDERLIDQLYEKINLINNSDWRVANDVALKEGRTFINLSRSSVWDEGKNPAINFSKITNNTFYLDKKYYNLHPELNNIIEICKGFYKSQHIGQIYLSIMKPFAKVLPHLDRGEYYSHHHRLQIGLQNTERAIFTVGGADFSIKKGEVWCFDNLRTHEVKNHSELSRYSLIVDIYEPTK
jgi:aspartyl/asparaginyl beta-hydroxylase (cupin superfamily)